MRKDIETVSGPEARSTTGGKHTRTLVPAELSELSARELYSPKRLVSGFGPPTPEGRPLPNHARPVSAKRSNPESMEDIRRQWQGGAEVGRGVRPGRLEFGEFF